MSNATFRVPQNVNGLERDASMKLVLYGKKQCGLCQDARLVLEQLRHVYKFELVEIDIYEDETLLENFGLMIPVVEIEGEVVQYGRIHKDVISKRLTK